METKKLKQFVIQLSAEAGEYLRNHFYTLKNVVEHESGRLVTNVDIELAKIISQRIADQFSDHDIVIQGGSHLPIKSEFVWYIDPLEGRSHSARNIPVYTVNLALQHQGETILAAVNHSQTHQLFFAEKGAGAYLNGIEISVSPQADLAKAFIFIELPERKFNNQLADETTFDQRMKIVSELVKKAGQVETFRIGSFGQCLVAAGSFDAYIDLSGSSQKTSQLASHLILKEAGAVIVSLKDAKDGFVQIMATNNQLSQALEWIKSKL